MRFASASAPSTTILAVLRNVGFCAHRGRPNGRLRRGPTGAQQNALSPLNTFADVDGDGIVDFVQFGSTSYGCAVPTWWPGHGDGVFGMCPNRNPRRRLERGRARSMRVRLGAGGTSSRSPPELRRLRDPRRQRRRTWRHHRLVARRISFYENAEVLLGNTPQFLEPITVPANALLGWSGQAAPTAFYFADMNASGADDIIVQEVPAGGSTATAFGFVDVLAGTDGPASTSSRAPHRDQQRARSHDAGDLRHDGRPGAQGRDKQCPVEHAFATIESTWSRA